MLWVTTLYCAPAARTGNGRGREGGGVYPEFGVLGIQEGSSPALVREVGRQVALLPSYAISREEWPDVVSTWISRRFMASASMPGRQR